MKEVDRRKKTDQLWRLINENRGQIDFHEIRNVSLSVLFYYCLSLKEEIILKNIDAKNIVENKEIYGNLNSHINIDNYNIDEFRYIILPEFLFSKIIQDIHEETFNLAILEKACKSIVNSTKGKKSQKAFMGIFNDLLTWISSSEVSKEEKNSIAKELILGMNDIFSSEDNINNEIPVYAFDFLINQFAFRAGRKSGEYYYTPSGPAELLCKLVCSGLTEIQGACDPTCGTGSLLLYLKDQAKVEKLWGQEISTETYNICRMNLILHEVPYDQFQIFNDDTIVKDCFGKMKFQVQVSNPPYGYRLNNLEAIAEDDRFKPYENMVTKTKADFLFLQHMIHHMTKDGRIASIFPDGVLYRKGSESGLRKEFVEKTNIIDAVIALPSNVFIETGVKTSIIVCRKDRSENKDNILFIDGTEFCERRKQLNVMESDHVNEIAELYQQRENVEGKARVVPIKEVEEHGYNLHVPEYVHNVMKDQESSLSDITDSVRDIDQEIAVLSEDLRQSLFQLGLEFPF